jgi:hydroxymethylpyrimidine/phosphomethylpyrimidine kinase
MGATIKRVLTIAGSDPSGGAGIQADLKAVTLLGGYGMSVLTALTAQNTLGVQEVFPLPASFVQNQLEAVLSDIGADAVKTGMLAQADIITEVARGLKRFKVGKLVVDPVMVSQSGHALLQEEAVQPMIEKLFPLAGLITPNLPETKVLTGTAVKSLKEMKKAARKLKEKTPGAVLIKGGHLSGSAVDLLCDGTGFREYSSPRVKTLHTHGTGCTYSSAIATLWGQGRFLREAISGAKDFIYRAILAAEPLGKGHGPTNPQAWIQRELARYPAVLSLLRAAETLKQAKIGNLIAEVQSNLGFALPLAQGPEDVAAFPGRIIRWGETIRWLGMPSFGASRHVARIILTVMTRFPEYRSAMNLRFSEELLRICSRLGFRIAAFDRRKEPQRIKRKEGSTLSWGVNQVLEKAATPPDLIVDRGDFGKEPMIRVLGKSPEEVGEKIARIGRKIRDTD